MASKVLPHEKIGDDLPILLWQKKRIMKNCQFKEDIKAEWVQWITGDVRITSLSKINQSQAKKIIMAQEGSQLINDNWGFFNKENPKHELILSLMHQAKWTKNELPDIDRLSTFLKSDKSPVKKPLKEMNDKELEKIIVAISGIIKSTYK